MKRGKPSCRRVKGEHNTFNEKEEEEESLLVLTAGYEILSTYPLGHMSAGRNSVAGDVRLETLTLSLLSLCRNDPFSLCKKLPGIPVSQTEVERCALFSDSFHLFELRKTLIPLLLLLTSVRGEKFHVRLNNVYQVCLFIRGYLN